MGKPTGFLEIHRLDRAYAPVDDRILHFKEFSIALENKEIANQGGRCMDCGIPYCHQGCPVDNLIPEWNDLVYRGKWPEALRRLHSTNNFPEFTGRVCPAPCEASCTLNITDEPVTIKSIECALVDRGWQEGWIHPVVPKSRSGKRIAVIGSGPAGMACAQQLARAGHKVVVFEKNSRIGGLLRIGIPDFKMDKRLIDRRIAQMQTEGVEFHPNSAVGNNIPIEEIIKDFDAIALCCGSEFPRDLSVPGRDLKGVHYAMDFLSQQNDRNAGALVATETEILAKDKHVIVIGGGDTGSDCVGTSIRQGAESVMQLELLPKPPDHEDKSITWPNWPLKLRSSSSHEEGCGREWSVMTKSLCGNAGKVTDLKVAELEWSEGPNGGQSMVEIEGSETRVKADLVLLAMGFAHPIQEGLLNSLGVKYDSRGNVAANDINYKTSISKVFAAGDMRRGQSLVVWAIREGRECAAAIDNFLIKHEGL